MSIDSDEYEIDPSSASFHIDYVQGIIFGGISSRFWMLRKHLCSLSPADHRRGKTIPFYAWNCLTLQLKHRDVDLVIKSDKHMDRFLKFLVFHMNTVDGNRDIAVGIYKTLFKQMAKNTLNNHKSKIEQLPEWNEHLIKETIKHQIMKKTMQRYNLVRIRLKISYTAFEKQ